MCSFMEVFIYSWSYTCIYLSVEMRTYYSFIRGSINSSMHSHALKYPAMYSWTFSYILSWSQASCVYGRHRFSFHRLPPHFCIFYHVYLTSLSNMNQLYIMYKSSRFADIHFHNHYSLIWFRPFLLHVYSM